MGDQFSIEWNIFRGGQPPSSSSSSSSSSSFYSSSSTGNEDKNESECEHGITGPSLPTTPNSLHSRVKNLSDSSTLLHPTSSSNQWSSSRLCWGCHLQREFSEFHILIIPSSSDPEDERMVNISHNIKTFLLHSGIRNYSHRQLEQLSMP